MGTVARIIRRDLTFHTESPWQTENYRNRRTAFLVKNRSIHVQETSINFLRFSHTLFLENTHVDTNFRRTFLTMEYSPNVTCKV